VTNPVVDSAAVVDEELEKRKKRAARFGVPLVETSNPRSSPTKRGPSAPRNAATLTAPLDVCSCHQLPCDITLIFGFQDSGRLQARAARFGIGKPSEPVIGKKRSVEEIADAEELEKRKKRAERFGIPPVVCRLTLVYKDYAHKTLRETRLEKIVLLCVDTNCCSTVHWRNLYGTVHLSQTPNIRKMNRRAFACDCTFCFIYEHQLI
jgi:hypothetical protein